jgi:hypothetical protein
MPPVGDLDRVRQRVPHGLRVGGRDVPAHHLDPRMRPQPPGHHRCAAPGQHVDPDTGVGVDHHGGVVVTPTQGEIVDPQHLRHRQVLPARLAEALPDEKVVTSTAFLHRTFWSSPAQARNAHYEA